MVFWVIEWRRRNRKGRWEIDVYCRPFLREKLAVERAAKYNASGQMDEYRVRKAKLFPLKGT